MNLLDEDYLDAFLGDAERLSADRYFDTTADFFSLLGFDDAAKKLHLDAQVVYDPTPTEQFPNGRFTVERVDWRPLGEGPDGRGWWGSDWDPFATNGKLEFDP